ncbi:hypothetical protein LQ757_01800 [Agromyces sp. SYSU K20354]|uniref:hypothetical protein n=1 Tax=Agromyces cavernae TaxID=2898659 RepID=UPI001E622231|nr:hypothetical protein [Agromyces cavernae]MCD2440999.1 hypothetical protein [Agromyces cavernae]
MTADLDLRTVLLLLLAVGAVVAAWYVARSSPRLVVAGWAAVCFLVPIWIGVQAGVYWSALTGVTLVALAAWSTTSLTFSYVDVLVVGFVVLVLAAFLLGGSTWGHVLIVSFGWLVPYVWGRFVLARVEAEWLYSCIAVAATAAAVLGIIEFATAFNPFVEITTGNIAWRTWHELQPRAGFIRAEGAFGHSIAFASSLAVSSVFVLVTKWPAWVRLACLSVVIAAVATSFSRIGLVTLAITLLLAVILLGRWITRSMRAAVALLLIVAAATTLPTLGDVFTEAGEEAGGSAQYRSDLVTLLRGMRAIGISTSWTVLPSGETYYGSFQSIDSELMLTGLRFGILPLLALVVAIACCILSLVRGRATPAAVAVAAQIPAFAAVALITQYGYLVWFVAGVAVTAYQVENASDKLDRADASISPPRRDSSTVDGARRERVRRP